MEKNLNHRIVQIDVAQFRKLMSLASIGADESNGNDVLRRIQRHVWKFNEAESDSARNDRLIEERERRDLRKKTIGLMNRKCGKTIYVRVSNSRVLLVPARLMNLTGQFKDQVRVRLLCDMPYGSDIQTTHVNTVVEELPEGFQELVSGPNKGSFMLVAKPSLMKIRLHRGGLAESMETLDHIQPTIDAICEYFLNKDVLGFELTDTITVEPYSSTPTHGWDEHWIVKINGSPAAFTDMQVK